MSLQKIGRKSRQGFTLTELAIVLGIIGLILGSIWVAAGRVSSANKAQKASNQAIQILTNYRSLYAQHGVDVADGTDVTCLGVNANFFPVEMVSSACTTGTTSTYPTGPWLNGYVQVTVSQTYSGISIGYYGLSREGCNAFAGMAADSQDLIYENVNGTAQYLAPIAANSPYTSAQIAADCAGATGDYVQLMYKAR